MSDNAIGGWIKMWVEAHMDPDVTQMPLEQQAVYFRLLLFAGRHRKADDRGKIDTSDVPKLARAVANGDVQVLRATLDYLQHDWGTLVPGEGGLLVFRKWKVRQARTPSDEPEAVRERVREHRARKAGEQPETQVDGVAAGVLAALGEEATSASLRLMTMKLNSYRKQVPPDFDFVREADEAITTAEARGQAVRDKIAFFHGWMKKLARGEPAPEEHGPTNGLKPAAPIPLPVPQSGPDFYRHLCAWLGKLADERQLPARMTKDYSFRHLEFVSYSGGRLVLRPGPTTEAGMREYLREVWPETMRRVASKRGNVDIEVSIKDEADQQRTAGPQPTAAS